MVFLGNRALSLCIVLIILLILIIVITTIAVLILREKPSSLEQAEKFLSEILLFDGYI